MQLGDNGIPTVSVHYFDERVNTSGFIDMVADLLVLTQIDAAVGNTVSLFQDPHLLRRQVAVHNHLPDLTTAIFRKVGDKLFYIHRNFQNVGVRFWRCCYCNIQVAEPEILYQ